MQEMLCILLLPILLGVVLAFVPGTFAGLAAFIGTAGLFLAVNYFGFTLGLRDMTIIYPMLGIGLTYLGSESWRNLVVEKRATAEEGFSNYVSPDW